VLLCSLQAQQRVDVTIHQDVNPLQMFLDTTRDTTLAIGRARELQIQQGYLDLARQQAEDARRAREQSARLQDRVLDDEFGFRAARREWATWKINQDVMDAFAHGRAAHPDFDALLPAMRIVADSLRPEWSRITMSEYVECLYVIARNASFASGARAALLKTDAQAPEPK